MTTIFNAITQSIRKSGPNPAKDPPKMSGYLGTYTGAKVNEDGALTLSAFMAGVRLISTTVAGFPLHVYQSGGTDGVDERYYGNDVAFVTDPNPEQTRQEFLERVVGDEVLGDGFIYVEKWEDTGLPRHLWHVERRRMQVGRTKAGLKAYLMDGKVAMIDYAQGGEIVHVPNWGRGIRGFDLVKGAANAIALGLTAEEYASQATSDGAIPPGMLNTQDVLDEAEAEKVAASFTKSVRTAGKTKALVAVLSGATFQPLSVDPEKMQLESLRKFQANDMATIHGAPPHMIGLVEKVSSWGTGVAEQTRGFVTFTADSHMKRFEQAYTKHLLVKELTGRYCKFDPDGLMRGTTLQRYQAHALGYSRWLTANEIRRDENLPPVDGGDTLFVQSGQVPVDEINRMVAAEQAAQQAAQRQ